MSSRTIPNRAPNPKMKDQRKIAKVERKAAEPASAKLTTCPADMGLIVMPKDVQNLNKHGTSKKKK